MPVFHILSIDLLLSIPTKYNSRTIDTLQFATLLYLGIPLVLFFISWLKWYYAITMVGLLILPILSFSIKVSHNGAKKFGKYFLVFCGFLLLLGYGEVFPQSSDWGKHNAIFSNLYHNWDNPVFISYNGFNYTLCYGLGYYMIPAWIAGLFKSYFLIRWLVLFNSAIGLALIGLWCNRVWHFSLWISVLLFLIGNVDWINDLFWLLKNYSNRWDIFYVIGNLQFLTTIDQTPQHGISIILAFLVIFHQFISTSINFLFCLTIIVLGFFWSPFIIFALLPLVFLVDINQFNRINRELIFWGLPTVLVSLFLYYYYSLHLSIGKPSFEILSLKKTVYMFVTRYSLLFGIKVLVIFFIHWKMKFLKPLEIRLILSFLLIYIIFKQIHYGFFNDFDGKSTFLILFIMNVYLIRAIILHFSSFNRMLRVVVCLFVFALSFMPLKCIYMKILAFYSPKYREQFDVNKYLITKGNAIQLENVLKETSEKYNYPFMVQYLGGKTKVSKQVMKRDKQEP